MVNCESKTRAVVKANRSESMTRSVTTVPSDLTKDTRSLSESMPQRTNSPIRGMTRLTA